MALISSPSLADRQKARVGSRVTCPQLPGFLLTTTGWIGCGQPWLNARMNISCSDACWRGRAGSGVVRGLRGLSFAARPVRSSSGPRASPEDRLPQTEPPACQRQSQARRGRRDRWSAVRGLHPRLRGNGHDLTTIGHSDLFVSVRNTRGPRWTAGIPVNGLAEKNQVRGIPEDVQRLRSPVLDVVSQALARQVAMLSRRGIVDTRSLARQRK